MRQITELFGTILGYFYGCTGDLGIAIVCLTVAVRLCLLPFSLRQRRSMENQQANPAGCLLLLVQFPIMIGLYQSIAAGVTEQAGTRLLPWVGSLLARDPYGNTAGSDRTGSAAAAGLSVYRILRQPEAAETVRRYAASDGGGDASDLLSAPIRGRALLSDVESVRGA